MINPVSTQEPQFEFHAERQIWSHPNEVALHCIGRGNGYARSIALPVSFTDLSPNCAISTAPMMQIPLGAAQSLMDTLWNIGIRPTSGEGSAGQLLSTQRHLEDMRQLVFKKDIRPLIK